MEEAWIFAIGSVLAVSLISLIGLFTLSLNQEKLGNYLHALVSFSAGALLADAFIHLLPEAIEAHGFGLEISVTIIAAIIFSFIVEKFIRWRHC
ncbi:MAG: ZIP family metal transporter, partial [archaeon]|nr:ZIP family metal transporter [archaeon]